MKERNITSPNFYIKSLSVHGFKSFGEETQKFTFTRGINLVVGANGSGKSNILDAICFALCAKTSSLRVRYISELQSTETREPCEVTLELAESGTSDGDRTVNLSASINPDNSRVYKVDGKLKTFKEVKEMLQEMRLYLEGSGATIHQSQVTELADNNSPKLIASIISDASGAGRWNEEVSKAEQEACKTRKGLDEIHENIALLEKIIEKDQESLKLLRRLRQLESELSALSSNMQAFLLEELTSIRKEIDEKFDLMNKKELSLQERQLLLCKRKEKIKAMRMVLKVPTKEFEEKRNQLVDSVVSKEEQKSAYERKIKMAKDAIMKLSHLDEMMNCLDENLSYINLQIGQKQNFISRFEKQSPLHSDPSKCAHYYREIQESRVVSEEKLQELIIDQLGLVNCLNFMETEKQCKEGHLIEAKQMLQTLYEKLNLIDITDTDSRMKALLQQKSELENSKSILENKHQSVHAELGILSNGESSLPAWPLHSCFRFKTGLKDISKLFLALNIITGPLRKVCVTETTEAAAELLRVWDKQGNITRFCRIWPLDRLSVEDRLKLQKKAQQQYPDGSVFLPLEQLDFDAKFEKAIKRVFGGYVIAISDEVAKDLILRHKLWSVTIDGKINQLGSVSGGWRGDANSYYIQKKFEYDQLNAQLTSTDTRLTCLKTEIKELEKVNWRFEKLGKESEEILCKIKTIEKQVRQLDSSIKMQRVKLEENKRMSTFLETQIEENRRQLNMTQQIVDLNESERALSQAIKSAKEDEMKLQCMLDDTLYKQEEIRKERKDLELESSDLDNLISKFNSFEEETQLLKSELVAIESKINNAKMEEESNCLEFASETAAMNQDLEAISELQEEIRIFKKLILSNKSDAKETEDELNSITESKVDFTTLSGEKVSSKSDYQKNKIKICNMKEELKTLKQKEAHISIEQVSSSDKVQKLELYKERWLSVAESLDILLEGIENTKSKVQKVNETIYKQIRKAFQDCCKTFLPTKSVDLIKTGKLVEDGTKFSLLSNTDVEGSASEVWKTNLEELSGGQRTIISLAFILMVAKCSQSSLYLMDEVDAALDEHNQQSLAMLVKNVVGKTNQVICVSHNIAFQKHCERVIQVTRVDGHTKYIQSYNVSENKVLKRNKKEY